MTRIATPNDPRFPVEKTPVEALPRRKKVGGTRGGGWEFVVGLGLLAFGLYVFLSNAVVTGGYWARFSGWSPFGLALIPTAIGIAILFFKGSSKVGWGLLVVGVLAIIVGTFARMHVHFRHLSLWDTTLMIIAIAGGLGLIARAVRSHD